MTENLRRYFSGEQLIGDDFSLENIAEWYKDEAEGYAELGARNRQAYKYVYNQLNNFHAFRFLRGKKFSKALGIGSAWGDEFKPIISQLNEIYILDPSDHFSSTDIEGVPCIYNKPNISGKIDFDSYSFDLITCFGVLHHIPNVSFVMQELHRVLSRDGIMLLREPINSMGDWRTSRRGLTKRERGIPLQILDRLVAETGFIVRRRAICEFGPIPKLASKLGIRAYDNLSLTKIDAFMSRSFLFNYRYHRTSAIHKLAPSGIFYILEKA